MSEKEQGLRGRYIDARYQTAIGFGATSPYLQPWRAYQETLPVSALVNALGIHLNIGGEAPEPILKHLAGCGVRHARIEIGWGSAFAGADETTLTKPIADRLRSVLLACRANRVRPLMLLNAHHGVPCPMENAQKTLARPARKNDRVAFLSDVSGLRVNHSGFNNVSEYKACEVLFTRIEKNGRVTLSRPLAKDLGDAGKSVSVGTLRYLPFGFPDRAENAATRTGWQRYVLAVARFAAATLSPIGNSDRGFDMEIWNELSFGSEFLGAEHYFAPVPFRVAPYVFGDMVKAVSEVAAANTGTFAGVRLCNGFSNTFPWTASSTEPRRVTALSKHPYSSAVTYRGDPPSKAPVVNAAFVEEAKPAFYPSYKAVFPEYFFNALQTEHLIRDLSPLVTDVYGTKHGRFARPATDGAKAFRVWFTEWGIMAKEWGVTGADAAQNLKAKAHLRMFVFAVGKGLERLYFYAAGGEDTGFGMVSERFMRHAIAVRESPASDAAYRSPVLATLKRLTDAVAGSNTPFTPRPLVVRDIRDTHGHSQWQGDGSAQYPALMNRECVVFLPFQQSETRFVIALYVQTRDVTKSLPPERYTVIVSGFAHPLNVAIDRLYDPVTGANVGGARILYADGAGKIAVSLPLTDYPYLLFLSDAA